MKIVKILGGLGNQMFQYALYLALWEKFPNEEIMIDTSCFKGYPLHNGFELDGIFSLKPIIASSRDILKVAYPYPNYRCWQVGKYILPKRRTMCVEKKDFTFDETVLMQSGNRYFDGYWQHEEYFEFAKDVILRAFAFPEVTDGQNREFIRKVSMSNSVSLHIRRGDYNNHPYFKGICDLDYYKAAIEYLTQNVHPDLYCIFSNDIEWCKKELAALIPVKNIVYVNWNTGRNSFRDMQLMSCCKHNVIANSSFSWWGAWLNENPLKTVIAPSKWMNIEMVKDPIPMSWIRLH